MTIWRTRPRSAAAAVLALAATACSSSTPTGRVAASTTAATTPTATTPTTTATTPAPAAAVPAKYRSLYDTLARGLDAYQSAVDAMATAPANGVPVAATELLPANGNRLRQLLAPGTVRAVDAWLDRLRSLGLRGVTVGVKVPMLLPQFGTDGEAYTRFFTAVVQHAHARGMVVDVELGALFCGTAYAQCSFSFHGSYAEFVDATIAQARIVIDRIRPDNLTILSEPTTEVALTGVRGLGTVDGTARYVHDVVAGIGDRHGVKVGAGAACWLAPAYNQAILQEHVDYLAMHIYPMNAHIAANLVADTTAARKAGLPVVADEVGLYKTADRSGAGPATASQVFRIDTFSFFEPLDVRFAKITATWAKKAGVSYVSPFWSGQLFSYLVWSPQHDTESFAQLMATFDAAVRAAFTAGQLTRYGRTWTSALTGS